METRVLCKLYARDRTISRSKQALRQGEVGRNKLYVFFFTPLDIPGPLVVTQGWFWYCSCE
jgi:hypothetical protein